MTAKARGDLENDGKKAKRVHYLEPECTAANLLIRTFSTLRLVIRELGRDLLLLVENKWWFCHTYLEEEKKILLLNCVERKIINDNIALDIWVDAR